MAGFMGTADDSVCDSDGYILHRLHYSKNLYQQRDKIKSI